MFSANVTGLRAVEAKGGFTVTLTGNVTGGGALTMGKYNGAGFTACLVFDGDVSGFTSFVTSENQYNISHYGAGRAAYAFNAGLELEGETTFNVAKNAENQDGWIELGSTSRLTGNANIIKTGAGDLRIEGDTSSYTGTIKLQDGGLVLNGTNGQNIDLSLENAGSVAQLKGTGGVLQSVGVGGEAASGKLQMEADSSWNLTTVNLAGGKALTISGAGACTIGTLTSGEGGSLTVEQGSTVKLSSYSSGAIRLNDGTLELSAAGSLTSLTLGAGTSVETDLTTGILNFGVLSVSELTRAAGNAVLRLTGTLDGLQLQAASVEGTLHIALSDEFITTKLIGTDGYALFDNGSLWQDHVVFDNATYGSRLKISGNNLILAELPGLYWAGTEGSNTWKAGEDTQDWTDGKDGDATAFTNPLPEGSPQDVVFMPGDGVSTTVDLQGDLAPGNVTVGEGTGWVFNGTGNLTSGKITVGGEGGSAELTLSGTGYVHSEGLSLVGEGTRLIITSAPSENGKYLFKHMELGEGTELVLHGAAANYEHWDLTNPGNNNYASGAGSIVLEDTGIIRNGMSQAGILWAFFWNSESTHEGQTIGNLKLRSSAEGSTKTTLIIDGEMGSATGHGMGVVENLWVENNSSLVLRSRALGVTTQTRTLHLAGNGSNGTYTEASHEGEVTTDAALVLGWNRDEDHAGSIYWNVKTEADTSISVLADTGGNTYTWTLMKELNVGDGHTLTKKGAGTLKLGAGSTLVGSGDIVVSAGVLQVDGEAITSDYSGVIKVKEGGALGLAGGSFTGNVESVENLGTINLTGSTGGEISLTGDTMLRVSNGGSFTGTITLAGESEQKLGVFGTSGDDEANYSITLGHVKSTAGTGILVATKTTGGLTVTEATGLSEVWVGGPAGTCVTIANLTASGSNHSFTLDNGVFTAGWPTPGQEAVNPWAGNSGQLIITGDVTGYTSFTAKRKGETVTDGLDLIFRGTVAMGDKADVTINATYSEHDNNKVYGQHGQIATILFDETSSITGSGSMTKQGGGTLVLAGIIAADSWSLDVQAGTVELGKSNQEEGTLDYSLTGLSIAQGSTVEVRSACHLTLTGALNMQGGALSVTGDLNLQEKTGDALNTINVVGGTLTVTGSLYGVDGAEHSDQYYNHAHAGKLVVGSDASAGTVTIGTEEALASAEEEGDATNRPLLQVYSLDMNNTSTVTVYGNLSLGYDGEAPDEAVTSTIAGGTLEVKGDMVNQETLAVTGGTVTIDGNYSGDATSLNGGGSIELNGTSVTMTVGGVLNVYDNPDGDVYGHIKVTGGATLTATGGIHGNEAGGQEKYFDVAHAGELTVGDATTIGTLTVGDCGLQN